jgi:urease accessory protein
MITVNKLLSRGKGLSAVLLARAASVVLDWDTRQKSRFDTEDSLGRTLGVFLPRGSTVRGGDVLVAEDGSLVKVVAQPQAVMRITACAVHGTPFDLVRAAYHLGNRHVQIELTPEHLQIEPDHVLAEMLQKMHLDVTELLAPFEPEGGAYASQASHAGPGHEHAHDHAHGQPHEHDHGHHARAKHGPAEHAHDTGHAGHAGHAGHVGHVHGPDCQHDH